jgi:CheY-like chemotaxis protein
MSQTLVLSVGSDSMVLNTRGLILRSAGYIVVTAMSIKEAVHLFHNGDFDLIILCHTLPMKDCERLTCFIRASGSRIPIVYVSGTGLGEHITLADATLDKDPVAFLRNLGEVLSKHAKTQAARVPVPRRDSEVSSGRRQRGPTPGSIGTGDRHKISMDR